MRASEVRTWLEHLMNRPHSGSGQLDQEIAAHIVRIFELAEGSVAAPSYLKTNNRTPLETELGDSTLSMLRTRARLAVDRGPVPMPSLKVWADDL